MGCLCDKAEQNAEETPLASASVCHSPPCYRFSTEYSLEWKAEKKKEADTIEKNAAAYTKTSPKEKLLSRTEDPTPNSSICDSHFAQKTIDTASTTCGTQQKADQVVGVTPSKQNLPPVLPLNVLLSLLS